MKDENKAVHSTQTRRSYAAGTFAFRIITTRTGSSLDNDTDVLDSRIHETTGAF